MRFEATTASGEAIVQGEHFPSVDQLPNNVDYLKLLSDDGIQVLGHIRVKTEEGERLHAFVRQHVRLSPQMHEEGRLSVPVFEVRKGVDVRVRLYLHPIEGPILSTQDLYF